MDNLKHIRKSENKTQKQIAEFLNIDQSTYSGYETGKREPDLKTLITLANYYNVSLDYLCGRPFNDCLHIPKTKLTSVKNLLSLSENKYDKANAYITALVDSDN